MQNNLYIPKKINVGFQKRKDTYTGKLAYIIYWDEKGKLRKETSWQNWRSDDIEPQYFDNTPTSGFVLNKKAGGYSTGWDYRQAYTRVYDPRGFEFEITIENLLYILENTSCIKGKGLEGDFVYGWDRADLILIPVNSPDYKEIQEFSQKIQDKKRFTMKDMMEGRTYLTKQGEKWIYMGRHFVKENVLKPKKAYFFTNGKLCTWNTDDYYYFETVSSLTDKIVDEIDSEIVFNYAELRESLKNSDKFSERDKSKDIFIPLKQSECFNENGSYILPYTKLYLIRDNKYIPVMMSRYYGGYFYNIKDTDMQFKVEDDDDYWVYKSIGHVFDNLTLYYLTTYKYNGELEKEWK